jgi:hypothetical protein
VPTDVAAPQDPEQPPSFISALRELASPVNEDVLNLAATLGTRPDEEEEHDHEHDQAHDQARLPPSRERLRLLESARQRDELDQRDRLRRVMSRLSRLSDSADAAAAYGDRVPSQNNLYDWSPANEADDEARQRSMSTRPNGSGAGAGAAENSLRSTAILQSVRRHPRFSARTREYLQRYQSQSEREAANRPPSQYEPPPRYNSHRSLREMLAANRSRLQSESPEREREREAPTSESAARQMAMQRLSDGRSSLERDRRDMRSTADSYRRSFFDRSSNASPAVSPMLEQTVKYLAQIRHSNTIDESINSALEAGFLSKDYFCMQDFVIDTYAIPPPAETSWLAPGAVLSGCQHATAMNASVTATAPGTNSATIQFHIFDSASSATPLSRHPGLPPPIRPWIWNRNEATNRPSQLPEPQPTQQDRWPVKVTIHDVDWEKMSLSATMEAYNVPSHPHSHSILNPPSDATPQVTRTSSITTYLEGEILDFNNHTLLTESFKSNAANDATYWRKLPPFQKMSDDAIVRALTSRKWFAEVLGKDYILMRWKERCFVKSLNNTTPDPAQPPHSTTNPFSFPDSLAPNPWSSANPSTYYPPSTHASQLQPSPYRIVRNAQTGRAEVEITPQPLFNTNDAEHATFDDSGCGLTISGFYYVSLDRRTGGLEGLYYDPQSSPYQCLKLESIKGGLRSAWAFR